MSVAMIRIGPGAETGDQIGDSAQSGKIRRSRRSADVPLAVHFRFINSSIRVLPTAPAVDRAARFSCRATSHAAPVARSSDANETGPQQRVDLGHGVESGEASRMPVLFLTVRIDVRLSSVTSR
ncbi:MAG: hypothetical protein ACLUEV_02960 [Alistipes sp.]